jgi:hypothetical protein
MASKKRKRVHSIKRIAIASIATATVSALMVGTAPPQTANAAAAPVGGASTVPGANTITLAALNDALAVILASNLRSNALAAPAALASTSGSPGLPPMALAPGAPDPASIPDLTFGLGPRGYDLFQSVGAALESGFLNNVNLSGVLQALGYDPETAINTALGNLLVQTLTGVTVDPSSIPVLGSILAGAGYTNVAALLDLIGFNLADPFNLAGAPTPGLNIITAGPPFSLLKFLGVDLGWTPGFPNSVADEINNTPYLDVGALSVLETLLAAYPVPPLSNTIPRATLQTLIATVKALPGGDLNAVDVRVPVVLGFGLGAFAAGMAYPQVVAQLPFQPGGAQYTGDSPLLGSLTILPMILLRNPGRANGGLFARFYPEAALLGIDTITPDTEVSSSVNPNNPINIPVGNTGIVLGGANLVPIKVDATVEYDPLSDVPAWPNPVSLANSAAALFFPTYILRGVTDASLTQVVDGQLKPQLAQALGNTSGPLALNLYLTVPVNNALPLLEPVRLPIDVINLFTGANLNNPIATAFEPVLSSLANLGYTDVKRTVVNGVPVYDRSLDQANVITPFGTLPSGVDWGQVPGDLLLELGAGIQQAISQGLVGSTPVVNPLAILANLLGISGLPGAAGATGPLSGITGLSSLAVNEAVTAAIPAAVQSQTPAPSATARAAVQSQDPAPSAAKVLADNTSNADVAPVSGTSPTVDEEPAKDEEASNIVTNVQSHVTASVEKARDDLGSLVTNVQGQIRESVKAVPGAASPSTNVADKPGDNDTDQPGDNAADEPSDNSAD